MMKGSVRKALEARSARTAGDGARGCRGATGTRALPHGRLMRLALVGAALTLGGLGCSKGGSGASSNGDPLRPKVIDDKLLASVLGEFAPKDDPDKDDYHHLTIAADKIRCNHSNYKDEYTSHPYSVVFAMDGAVALEAEGGALVIRVDEEGGKFTIDAKGICSYGIASPYEKVKPLEGKPAELLDPTTPVKRAASKGKLGEAVEFPRGSVTLVEAKRSTWTDNDSSTPVVELKLMIQAPAGSSVEPFLAADLASTAGSDGEVWRVSCDEAASKRQGNPSYKSHREPAFDQGTYTNWVARRDTLVKAGKARTGWVTLLMDKPAAGQCKVSFDALGLGGGVVEWATDFD